MATFTIKLTKQQTIAKHRRRIARLERFADRQREALRVKEALIQTLLANMKEQEDVIELQNEFIVTIPPPEYDDTTENEAVELFMLNTDDRDERLRAHYREGKVVDGKWVNNVEEERDPTLPDYSTDDEAPLLSESSSSSSISISDTESESDDEDWNPLYSNSRRFFY